MRHAIYAKKLNIDSSFIIIILDRSNPKAKDAIMLTLVSFSVQDRLQDTVPWSQLNSNPPRSAPQARCELYG